MGFSTKRLIIGGLLVGFTGFAPFREALADERTDHDLQQWSMVTINTPTWHRLRGYFEVQPRVGDNITEMDRLIVRPAVGVQLNKAVSLWQGYGWTPGFQPKFNDEHRIFQQALVENKFSRFDLVNRTRLEERFIQGLDRASIRARHQVRVVYPLGKEKKWAMAAYNEFFVNLNEPHNGPPAGYDQNRVFVGLNRKLGNHARLEGGYIANNVNRRGPSNRMNHVLLVWLNVNL